MRVRRLIPALWNWASTQYVLTSERLILRKGLIDRYAYARELHLSDIEDVQLRQSSWGRALGFGDLLVEVTGARNPCAAFADRMGLDHWVKRFGRENRNGAYLRVLETGTLGAGDAITVEHRPGHGVTVADTGVVKHPATMARLLSSAEELSLELNPRLRKAARRAAKHA